MSYLDSIICRGFVKGLPAILEYIMSRFIQRHFQIPRAEIGYLRFILESYDGLAVVSTLDNRAALVEITFSESRRQDVEGLLESLAVECCMVAAPSPAPIPPAES